MLPRFNFKNLSYAPPRGMKNSKKGASLAAKVLSAAGKDGLLGLLQKLPQILPLLLCAMVAAGLTWLAGFHVARFYQLHLIVTGLLFVLFIFLSCDFFLIHKKPKPFSRNGIALIQRHAKRFYLGQMLIHTSLALVFCLLLWGLVWLVGPRVWVLMLMALVHTLSLMGLIYLQLGKIPPTLSLCWTFQQKSGWDYRTWEHEYLLVKRLRATLQADLSKEEPDMLNIVRMLEDVKGVEALGAGEMEWSKQAWQKAYGSRLSASAFAGLCLLPVVMGLMAIFVGSLSFASFPPGYKADGTFMRAALEKAAVEVKEKQVVGADAQDSGPDGSSAGGQNKDAPDSSDAGNGAAAANGGEAAAGNNKGEKTSNAADETEFENAIPDDGSQDASNFEDMTAEEMNWIEDDGSESEENETQQNEAQQKQGLPNPLDLPGNQPGGEGNQGQEGKNGAPQSGEKGAAQQGGAAGKGPQPGSGEQAGKPSQPKSGAGSGQKGQASSENADGKGESGDAKGTAGKGPQDLEFGGGGGPLEGKPGPPSPPGPASQELVKIEVPPVEAGKIKRKSLSEEKKQGNQKAQTTAYQASGAQKGKVAGKGEAEQTLPNWILLMLKEKN